MSSKVIFRKLLYLITPLIIWAFLTWFKQERLAQIIAYPLSYLSILLVFNCKSISKAILKLGIIVFLIIYFLTFYRNIDLNFIFYGKTIWLLVLGLQLINCNSLYKLDSKLYIGISRFVRYFLLFSILLFVAQLGINSKPIIANGKFTGGWFDANYFSSFCLLIFIGLSEILIKLKKHNNESFYSEKVLSHLKNTLKYILGTILVSLSLTNIGLLLFYSIRFLNLKFYRLICMLVLSILFSASILFSQQSMGFLNKSVLKNIELESTSPIQSYYQTRLYSLKLRLLKTSSIINSSEIDREMATHNSLLTNINNLKFNYKLDNYSLIFSLLVFVIMSFVLIKLIGFNIGINFIIISLFLDTFYSGFSLSLPILYMFNQIKISTINYSE